MAGVGQCQRAAGDGGSVVRGAGVHVTEEDGDGHHDGHVCSGDHREADITSASASLQSGKVILYISIDDSSLPSLQVPAPDCCTPANLYPSSNIEQVTLQFNYSLIINHID